MLRDLTIKNYRAFKDFSIDGLARVNLIVGKNNAGKTSFLEAVYLLASTESRSALLQLLHNRGEYTEHNTSGLVEYEYPLAHLFSGHQPTPDSEPTEGNTIGIESHGELASNLQIVLKPVTPFVALASREGALSAYLDSSRYESAFRSYMANHHELFPFELHISHDSNSFLYSVDDNFAIRTSTFRPGEIAGPNRYVTPSNANMSLLAQLWDLITPYPEKEDRVVEALQILEPDIEDLRLMSSRAASRFLIKRKDARSRIPLSSLGDGYVESSRLRHQLLWQRTAYYLWMKSTPVFTMVPRPMYGACLSERRNISMFKSLQRHIAGIVWRHSKRH